MRYERLKLMLVEWIDATTHQSEDLKDIDKKSPEEYLTKSVSVGWLLKENKKAMILMHGESAIKDSDIIAIPQDWVINKKVIMNATKKKGTK